MFITVHDPGQKISWGQNGFVLNTNINVLSVLSLGASYFLLNDFSNRRCLRIMLPGQRQTAVFGPNLYKYNIKVSSVESNGNIQKKESRSYCTILDNKSPSVTLKKLVMNARGVNCNFVISIQDSLFQILFKSKGGQKAKCCLEYGFKHESYF